MGGGGKTVESNSTSSTQNQGTWAPHQAAQPGYGFMAGNLQQLMQQPVPYFPGQTYVSPSAATQQGINTAMTAAGPGGSMNQVLGQAGQNYGFLSNAADVANNPHVQAMNRQTTQDLNQNLTENLLPQVNQGALGVNALGSARHGMAQGQAIGQTQDAIQRGMTNTNMGAYGQGLNAQSGALGQTGNMLGNLLQPANAMGQAGQAVEGYQGQALGDAMARFQHQYGEPWQRMNNMGQGLGFLQPMGTTQGSGFGSGTSTQPNPNYQSPLQTGLGLAGMGVGMASGLGWKPFG